MIFVSTLYRGTEIAKRITSIAVKRLNFILYEDTICIS